MLKMRFLAFTVLFVLVAAVKTAAQPVVTSFTPSSGPVSTPLTITGTGFNASPGSNIVYFGAVKAAVISGNTTTLTVVVPAGATYQPLSVLNTATGLTGYASKPFITTFTNPSGFGINGNYYLPKVDISVAQFPTVVALGDIDGDGKADMVVSSRTPGSISVFRNISVTGTVTAASFAPKVDFATTTSFISGVAITDMDGDGKPDIIVSNESSNIITVFRNVSTPGSITGSSLAPRIDLPSPNFSSALMIGDLDGDGKPDIAYTQIFSDTVVVIHNDATPGNLTAAAFANKAGFPAGLHPVSLSINDMDRDGKPDLVVAGGSSISVLRNTASKGSISSSSFAGRVEFATGHELRVVSTSDVDGDGRPEIMVTSQDQSSTSQVSVLRNVAVPGTIDLSSFSSPVDFLTGSAPVAIQNGDLDGDGKPDMVILSLGTSSVSVFRNIATQGTIAASSFAPKVDFAGNGDIFSVAIGDIDGDGIPELAVTNVISAVSLWKTRPQVATPVPPVITSLSPASSQAGVPLTINGTGFNSTPANNTVYFGAVKAVVTSATTTSLTVTVPGGATYQPVSVLVNPSGLTAYSPMPFIPTFTIPAGTGIGADFYRPKIDFSIIPAVSGFPYSFAVGDVDGDGKPDMAVVNANTNTICVMRNTSATGSLDASSFTDKMNFTTGFNPLGVLIKDMDGDGRPDLIVTNNTPGTISILRNTAVPGGLTASSFEAKVDFAVDMYAYPYASAIGDINGDGKPDIVVANTNLTTISVLQNNSIPGSFSASSFGEKVDFPTSTTAASPRAIAIGDVDGDGKPDIVVTNEKNNRVSVLRNVSSSLTITPSSLQLAAEFATGGSPTSVVISDIDGDGKPEIITGNYTSNTVSVLRNTSAQGSINAASFAAKTDFATGSNPFSVAAGDANGDGKPDLAIANAVSNTLSILRNTATPGSITASSFAAKVDFATGVYPISVTIADLDADGIAEAAAVSSSSKSVSVFKISLPADPVAPPVITSFSPATAPAGSTVTITGLNFNAVAAGNVVYFGAVKAAITGGSATSLTVTVPAGATHLPISVLNTANNLTGYSITPFTITFTNPFGSLITNNFYDPKVDLATNQSPVSVTNGDLDGDGKADIIVVNQNPGGVATVSVYRNVSANGSINASSFAAKTDFAVGDYASTVLARDMDGDGKLDLVVKNGFGFSISVLRNISVAGSISFAPKTDYATNQYPGDMSVSDIDKDGKPDIVVSYAVPPYNFSVFRNTSVPGGFTALSFTKIDFTPGANYSATSDIDGDGKPDILLRDVSTSTMYVLRNISTPGSISTSSFAPKVYFGKGSQYTYDADGDGKLDLIYPDSVNINTSTPGIIATSSHPLIIDHLGSGNGSIYTSADADGDGRPDVFNSDNSSLSIQRLIPSANGSFTYGPKAIFVTGSNPSSFSLGDLDGDGIAETVVTNSFSNTLSIYKINPLQASPAITSLTPARSPAGAAVTISGANFNTTASANIVYFGPVRASVTGGSATSLTVTVPAGATYQPVSVLNSARGLTGYSSNPFIPTFTSPFGDNIPANFYRPKVDFATGTLSYGIATGDLDGDGKPDMVTANFNANTISVLRNTTVTGTINASSFSTKVDFATGTNPYALVIRDMDGDGKPDIVVVNYGSSTLSVFRNTAVSGSLTSSSFAAKADFSLGNFTYPIAVTAADLDGDGKPELITANTLSNTVSVLRNISVSGSINASSFEARVDFATGAFPHAVATGDIDGDGRPDLVVANQQAGTVSVLRNTATSGTLNTFSFAGKVDFSAGNEPYSVAIGDLNEDGKPDLVVANHTGNLTVIRNTSNPGFVTYGTSENLISHGAAPFSVVLADVNGDGRADIVTANSVSSNISVLQRNINSSDGGLIAPLFIPAVEFATGGYPISLVAGDLDGDGMAEVITSNAANTISVLKIGTPSFSAVNAVGTQKITGEAENTAGRNMQVYPNPSTGYFTLQLTNLKTQAAAIEIFNEAGRTVQKRSLRLTDKSTSVTMTLSLDGQPAGVYYVKVTSVDGVRISKIIVQR